MAIQDSVKPLADALAALESKDAALEARIAKLETTPSPEPEPEPEPQPSEWPTASTTGILPGSTLRPSSTIIARTVGQVIENMDITGSIDIYADRVIVRNCRIRTTSFAGIIVRRHDVLIENCDVQSASNTTRGAKGVLVDGGHRCIIRKCNFQRLEDGIYIGGPGHKLEDNYITDLWAPTADPHYDGIQLHSFTTDTLVKNNAIMCRTTDSSSMTMGSVQRIVIEHNRIHGGAGSFRCRGENDGGSNDIFLKNNVIGPCWEKGTLLDIVATTNIRYEGNTDHLGNPIP